MFTNIIPYWLFSNNAELSNANAENVVNDPQNPTAINNAYLPSILKWIELTIKIPSMKEPNIFTISVLRGIKLNSNYDSSNLYLKNVPKIPPKPRKTNSNPFIHIR